MGKVPAGITAGRHLRGWPALILLVMLGCDARATRVIDVELPVDTILGEVRVDTVFRVDTLPGRVDTIPGDTVFRVDTLPGDTVRLEAVPDTLEWELEASILDYDRTRAELRVITLTARGQVFVRVELSGNSQKDEAWGLEAGGELIGLEPCPVVPDHPWLGDGWVHVGELAPGMWALEAVHAIEIECYPATDGFRSANSVHFQALRVITTRLEEVDP